MQARQGRPSCPGPTRIRNAGLHAENERQLRTGGPRAGRAALRDQTRTRNQWQSRCCGRRHQAMDELSNSIPFGKVRHQNGPRQSSHGLWYSVQLQIPDCKNPIVNSGIRFFARYRVPAAGGVVKSQLVLRFDMTDSRCTSLRFHRRGPWSRCDSARAARNHS